MSLLVQLAFRNLGRNRRRTALTVLTVALGTGLLTVALSMLNGILMDTLQFAAAAAGHVRVVDPGYARRDQLMPLAENLPDVEVVLAGLAGQPGVVGAYPHIAMGVTGAGEDQDIGETFSLLHGAPTAYYTEVLKLDNYLEVGRLPTADGEAALGKTFAEELGVAVGAKVIVLGQTQDGSPAPARLEVVGILDLGNKSVNRQTYVLLSQAQWLADLEGGATEVLVHTADYSSASDVAAGLRAQPALAALNVTAWDERPPFDSMGALLQAVRGIVAGIIVFITGLGVLNTMLMSVLERTNEIGVMRALGLTRMQTRAMFLVEALSISALGGIGGVSLGGTAALYLSHVGIHLGDAAAKAPAAVPIHETVYPHADFQTLAIAFLLGLAMAVVGGVIPAWRAAYIEPVEAMRHRR
jgi:putative ABC transport system permease protein